MKNYRMEEESRDKILFLKMILWCKFCSPNIYNLFKSISIEWRPLYNKFKRDACCLLKFIFYAGHLNKVSTALFLGAFVFVVVFHHADLSCIQRCITKFTEAEFSMETVQCSPNSQAFYLTVFFPPDNGWQQPTAWRLYAALLKKSWMEPLFPWEGLCVSLKREQGVKKAPCVQLLARLGSELKSPESLGSAVQRSNEPSGSTVSSDIPMRWGSFRDTAPSSLIWRGSEGASKGQWSGPVLFAKSWGQCPFPGIGWCWWSHSDNFPA